MSKLRELFNLLNNCKESDLMMEAVRTSETSVDNHFTRQYNPEDSSEHHSSFKLIMSTFKSLVCDLSITLYNILTIPY
jgi:hypothetical protein